MSALWSFLPVNPATGSDAPVKLIPLPGESVLTVTGPDSEKFLQGQTTTDFRDVNASTSRPGCLCNLKGRATVSYRALFWRDSYQLVTDGALLDSLHATLKKYIIFSKAQLATPDTAVFGIVGQGADAWVAQHFGTLPDGEGQVWGDDKTAIVRLPGAGRYLVLADAGILSALWEKLSADAVVGDINDWRLAQIRAGECQVLAGAAELFQPQELNLQVHQGVSYNKGCYTGQEIVARLYFRGKLKQWAHRFSVDSTLPPAIGSAICNENGQTAGHVILAARADSNRFELLAVARHDDLSGLHPADQPAAALTVLDLPYAIEPRE